MSEIKLPKHISGKTRYGRAHLDGQMYQAKLDSDQRISVDSEDAPTISKDLDRAAKGLIGLSVRGES